MLMLNRRFKAALLKYLILKFIFKINESSKQNKDFKLKLS
jgi:hypothetical protein